MANSSPFNPYKLMGVNFDIKNKLYMKQGYVMACVHSSHEGLDRSSPCRTPAFPVRSAVGHYQWHG